MLSVKFSSYANKFLKKSERNVADRLIESIEGLAKNPFPSGVKRVVSKKGKVFRIRVGDYRVSYAVFFGKNELLIIDIDKREKAY